MVTSNVVKAHGIANLGTNMLEGQTVLYAGQTN